MEVSMEASPWFIILAVALTILIVVLTIVIMEKIFFSRRMKRIQPGMTGKDIEHVTGYKLRVMDVDPMKNTFTARVRSPLRLFSYNLYFRNGRYSRRERNYRRG